jgi:hypothetical protein
MDLVEQLLGPELFKRYRTTASNLAIRLKMDWEVDQDAFDRAHSRWKNDLKREGFDPDDDRTLVLLLAGLGRRLFDERCVTYDRETTGQTSDAAFMQHQMLLHNYANEYTLLEFIRGIHSDVHYRKTTVRRLENRPVLVFFDPAELEYAFRWVRENPDRLRDYPALLKISP